MQAPSDIDVGPRLLVAGLLATLGLLVGLYSYAKFAPGLAHHVLWQQSLAIGPFLLAVLLLSRARMAARKALLLIFGVGIALQIIAMCTPPSSSDDAYRYLWDAKVQLAGIDPYRFAADAPQLEGLRTPFFFPHTAHCAWPVDHGTACSAINRPAVRTLYPPVAEGAFALVRIASLGGRGGHLPMQLVAALGAIAVAWLLARRAVAQGGPLWPVALWAWCPLVATEFGNNAHLDWLGVLFCVLAISCEAARRSGAAGLLVGAAIATKIYPGLVLMSLLRRRPALVIGGAVGLVVLSYLPHVLAIGPDVLGYLPGYLREERYISGGRFLLLDPWLPDPLVPVAAMLVLAVTALWVLRRTDPDAPEKSAVVLAGVVLLLSTPSYGWYALLLLALIVMSGAVEWLPVAIVPSFFYLIDSDFHLGASFGTALYGGALVASLAWFAVRRFGVGPVLRSPAAVRPAE
ncbi:MAG TPA: glycosyltransferase family 87 protein [Jatrophihabitans sp.]|nr:glycosyltransferase family 87 protein [Jatrophihabitans sp.]